MPVLEEHVQVSLIFVIIVNLQFLGVRVRPRHTYAPALSEGSFGFWVWTCTMTDLTAGRD